MFEQYLDEFIQSEEMREYLKTAHEVTVKIADIIFHAPASMQRKKEALEALRNETENIGDRKLNEDCNMYLNAIITAEKIMYDEGVFSVESRNYDEKTSAVEYEFDGIFAKYSDVEEYVKWAINYYEISDDMPLIFEAVKWTMSEQGKYVRACTYWIVRGEIWFAEVDMLSIYNYRLNIYWSIDLNLPVPFVAGDIVEVDLYPFEHKKILAILEIGDNNDCCSLQGLSRTSKGLWKVGAVKHGNIGSYVLPSISPLYTMTKIKGELPSDYSILNSVHSYIDGNEEKGLKLWQEFLDTGVKTDAEVAAAVRRK